MNDYLQMKQIINYFTHEYFGNWDNIYTAIKKKEFIHPNLLEEFINKDKSNYISIVDNDYPNNFKNIYMPPLTIYYIGDKELLNNNQIISLWGEYDLKDLKQMINNKTYVFAIKFENKNFEIIKELTSKLKQAVILIDDDMMDNDKQKFLSTISNFCYINEFPLTIKKISKSIEQNFERVLLGISNYSVIINPTDKQYQTFTSIHKFENRKEFLFKFKNTIVNEQRSNIKFINSLDDIEFIANS